jgi:putative membrane protein
VNKYQESGHRQGVNGTVFEDKYTLSRNYYSKKYVNVGLTNFILMKISTTVFSLAIVSMLWGCGTSNSNDSAAQADSINKAMADRAEQNDISLAVAESDSKFAVDAANGGMAEVQLGEVAQNKGTNPQVKEFGKMMVADHTKANDELKAIAASKNIALPTEPSEDLQKAAADITSKSGREFDKAYLKQMVKDHEKTVKLFEDGQKNVVDTEIKAFIDKTLPVLKTHLEHVKNLNKAN